MKLALARSRIILVLISVDHGLRRNIQHGNEKAPLSEDTHDVSMKGFNASRFTPLTSFLDVVATEGLNGSRFTRPTENAHDSSFLDVVATEGLNASWWSFQDIGNFFGRVASYVKDDVLGLGPFCHAALNEAGRQTQSFMKYARGQIIHGREVVHKLLDVNLKKWAEDTRWLQNQVNDNTQNAQEIINKAIDPIKPMILNAYEVVKDVILKLWHAVISVMSLSSQFYDKIQVGSVSAKASLCEKVWNMFAPLSRFVDLMHLVKNLFNAIGIDTSKKGFALSLEVSKEFANQLFSFETVSAASFGLGVNMDVHENVNRFCFIGGSNGFGFTMPPELSFAESEVGLSLGIWPNGMKDIFTGNSVSYCLDLGYRIKNVIPVHIPGCIVHGDTPRFPNWSCEAEKCPAVRWAYGFAIPFSLTELPDSLSKVVGFAEEEIEKQLNKSKSKYSFDVTVTGNDAPPQSCVWACGDRRHCGQSYYGTCDEVLNAKSLPTVVQGPFKQYQGSPKFNRKAAQDNDNPVDVPAEQACGRVARSCMVPGANREYLCQFWIPCLAVSEYSGGDGFQKYPTYKCIKDPRTQKAYPCRYCHPSGVSDWASQKEAPAVANFPKCVDDPQGKGKLAFFAPALDQDEERYVDVGFAPKDKRTILNNPSRWSEVVKYIKEKKKSGEWAKMKAEMGL